MGDFPQIWGNFFSGFSVFQWETVFRIFLISGQNLPFSEKTPFFAVFSDFSHFSDFWQFSGFL
jgi:hypothetical protein